MDGGKALTDDHERQHLNHEDPIPFDPLCWRCQAAARTAELGGEG